MKFIAITATTNPERSLPGLQTWGETPIVVVCNGCAVPREDQIPAGLSISWLTYGDYLGTVPAFRRGVDFALSHFPDTEILACLHDDVLIYDSEWVGKVTRFFSRYPACGLAGFGGAIGLGAQDLYQTPYNPMQLARVGFRSNLTDAEVHGLRSLLSEQVACLDGFSQIGRREFFLGEAYGKTYQRPPYSRPWAYLEEHGLIHHFYDGALGCLAARAGWETWYLPIRCEHRGGQTAVADRGYHAWAERQIRNGDHGFWEQSHQRGYDLFRDVLPLRV